MLRRSVWAVSLMLFLSAVPADSFAGDLDGTEWKMRSSGWRRIVLFWRSDVLKFHNGKFESAASVPYGFKPGPYDSRKIEEDVGWSAAQVNDRGEKMEWQGTVSGNRSLGTFRWTKANGKTVTVSWKAKRK